MSLEAKKFYWLNILPLMGILFLSSNAFSKDPKGRSPAFLPEETFVEEEHGMPKFLRIDVNGYNIRKSPEFRQRDTSNIDFKSERGSIYPIKDIVKLKTGNAINILVEDQERWVFVPYWRKNDFQLCYSEACFTDLTQVLKMLDKMNISADDLRACGYSLDAEGNLVDHNLPLTVEESEPQVGRNREALAKLSQALKASKERISPRSQERKDHTGDDRAPPKRYKRLAQDEDSQEDPEPTSSSDSVRMRVTPLWESAKGARGRQYTRLLSDAIDRYGRGLTTIDSLTDQDRWCPNFSQLSGSEKKEFWMHLFNAISKRESSFKERTVFDEYTYRNVYSGRIRPHRYSMGLFQMSYGSAAQRSYQRFCHFDWDRDRYKDVSDPSLTIYDPKNQMNCAVGVMNHWVSKDGGLGWSRKRGGARFWSTLRSSNPATRLVIASLRRYTPCWR